MCFVVQTNCKCQRNAGKHARLGRGQTGALLLIGRRVQTGHVNNLGHKTVVMFDQNAVDSRFVF